MLDSISLPLKIIILCSIIASLQYQVSLKRIIFELLEADAGPKSYTQKPHVYDLTFPILSKNLMKMKG
jgi:hypothetical protein